MKNADVPLLCKRLPEAKSYVFLGITTGGVSPHLISVQVVVAAGKVHGDGLRGGTWLLNNAIFFQWSLCPRIGNIHTSQKIYENDHVMEYTVTHVKFHGSPGYLAISWKIHLLFHQRI